MRLALAQIDTLVGDIRGNEKKILGALGDAGSQKADLVLFPELAVTGYPPEDLLLRPGFLEAAQSSLERIARQVRGPVALIGAPHLGRDLYNCLLYTSDAADDLTRVDLGGRRLIKKKKK